MSLVLREWSRKKNLNYTDNGTDFYCQNIYISICLLFTSLVSEAAICIIPESCYGEYEQLKPRREGEIRRGGVKKMTTNCIYVRERRRFHRMTGFHPKGSRYLFAFFRRRHEDKINLVFLWSDFARNVENRDAWKANKTLICDRSKGGAS